LLLLLRTALIAALALAAARPLVPARAGGAHQTTALVVILDNSPSAGAVVEGRAVLDRLRGVARASLGGAAPGDRLGLMLANRGLTAVEVLDGAVRVNVGGTPGAGPGPLVVTLGGRPVARTLAQPGATLTLPLPVTVPGWWLGEAVLDPDELRADDRRPFVR